MYVISLNPYLIFLLVPAFPAERQLLIAGGRKLEDTKSLADYKLKTGDTIHVGVQHAPLLSPVKPVATPTSMPSPVTTGISGGFVEGVSTSSVHLSKDQLLSSVMDVLGRLKAGVSHDQFVVAVQTISTLLGNALDSADAKYRKIRLSNATLHGRLLSKPGGVDALK